MFQDFKGGVLVPEPDVLLPGLVVGAGNQLQLSGTWPAGTPSGVAVYLQMWVSDAAGPQGYSASGAIGFATP